MGNNNNQKKTKIIRKMLRTATTIFAIIMAASASARRLDTDGKGQNGNTECPDGWINENGDCCNPKDVMPGSTCGRRLQGNAYDGNGSFIDVGGEDCHVLIPPEGYDIHG